MTQKQRHHQTLPVGKRLKANKAKPTHYNCPEGYAYIETIKGRTRISVLLDSGSNIFIINQNLVKTYISHTPPDKQLYLYSPLKEQTPLTEGGTINTLCQTLETERKGNSMTRNVKAMLKMRKVETYSNETRV